MSRRHRPRNGTTVRACWTVRAASTGLLHEVVVVEHREAGQHCWGVFVRGPLQVPRPDIAPEQWLVGPRPDIVPGHDGQAVGFPTKEAALARATVLTHAIGAVRFDGRWAIATSAPVPEGWQRWDPEQIPPWAPSYVGELEQAWQDGDGVSYWYH